MKSPNKAGVIAFAGMSLCVGALGMSAESAAVSFRTGGPVCAAGVPVFVTGGDGPVAGAAVAGAAIPVAAPAAAAGATPETAEAAAAAAAGLAPPRRTPTARAAPAPLEHFPPQGFPVRRRKCPDFDES